MRTWYTRTELLSEMESLKSTSTVIKFYIANKLRNFLRILWRDFIVTDIIEYNFIGWVNSEAENIVFHFDKKTWNEMQSSKKFEWLWPAVKFATCSNLFILNSRHLRRILLSFPANIGLNVIKLCLDF